MNKLSGNYDVPALKARFLALLGENAGHYPQTIERDFPRILEKLTDLWGSPVLKPYIDSLIFSDRPSRNGFPADVAAELFRLSNLHQTLHPSKSATATGWEQTDSTDLIERPRSVRTGQ